MKLLQLSRDSFPFISRDSRSKVLALELQHRHKVDKAINYRVASTSLSSPRPSQSRISDDKIAEMSLDPPTYLLSLQNNIRARPIPWDGAVRAGTLSEDQLSKIRAVDKVRKEVRKQKIEADVEAYTTLFMGGNGRPSVFQSAIKRGDVIQYLLVLLGDLIDGMHGMS